MKELLDLIERLLHNCKLYHRWAEEDADEENSQYWRGQIDAFTEIQLEIQKKSQTH